LEKKTVIKGDNFNINLNNSDTKDATSKFLNNNLFNYLRPFIIRPTRITSHSKTLID